MVRCDVCKKAVSPSPEETEEKTRSIQEPQEDSLIEEIKVDKDEE